MRDLKEESKIQWGTFSGNRASYNDTTKCDLRLQRECTEEKKKIDGNDHQAIQPFVIP